MTLTAKHLVDEDASRRSGDDVALKCVFAWISCLVGWPCRLALCFALPGAQCLLSSRENPVDPSLATICGLFDGHARYFARTTSFRTRTSLPRRLAGGERRRVAAGLARTAAAATGQAAAAGRKRRRGPVPPRLPPATAAAATLYPGRKHRATAAARSAGRAAAWSPAGRRRGR